MDSICKPVLADEQLLTAKPLCCPSNGGVCSIQPTSCSDTLGYCQNITQLVACSRATTEPVVQEVCQHKNSLFCLKSQTTYDEKDATRSAVIKWVLSRNALDESRAGTQHCCDFLCWNDARCAENYSWFATCEDMFSSGKCLIWQKGQTPTPFPYQVELCDANFTNSASIIGTVPSETSSIVGSTFIPSSSSNSNNVTNIPTTNGNQIVIIGATLGGAIVILVGIVVSVIYYFKHRKTLPVSLPSQEERIRNLEMELEQLRGSEGKNEHLQNVPHEQYQTQIEVAGPSRVGDNPY